MTENMDKESELINALKKSAFAQMKHHNFYMWNDCFFYNGGTVAVLLLTSLATFLPSNDQWYWVPRLMSGLTAAWISIDRALAFGPRWKFHTDMKHAYHIILDKLDTLPYFSNTKREKRIEQIAIDLENLRRLEGSLPGIGAGGSNGTQNRTDQSLPSN